MGLRTLSACGLYADFAPIPNNPLSHPGNRFTSGNYVSGGDSGGCTTATLECESICDFTCEVNDPIEFECFQLPSNWQELSSGKNVCYGIEILVIQFIDCDDPNTNSNCFPLQGGNVNCLIIG